MQELRLLWRCLNQRPFNSSKWKMQQYTMEWLHFQNHTGKNWISPDLQRQKPGNTLQRPLQYRPTTTTSPPPTLNHSDSLKENSCHTFHHVLEEKHPKRGRVMNKSYTSRPSPLRGHCLCLIAQLDWTGLSLTWKILRKAKRHWRRKKNCGDQTKDKRGEALIKCVPMESWGEEKLLFITDGKITWLLQKIYHLHTNNAVK